MPGPRAPREKDPERIHRCCEPRTPSAGDEGQGRRRGPRRQTLLERALPLFHRGPQRGIPFLLGGDPPGVPPAFPGLQDQGEGQADRCRPGGPGREEPRSKGEDPCRAVAGVAEGPQPAFLAEEARPQEPPGPHLQNGQEGTRGRSGNAGPAPPRQEGEPRGKILSAPARISLGPSARRAPSLPSKRRWTRDFQGPFISTVQGRRSRRLIAASSKGPWEVPEGRCSSSRKSL